MNKENEVLSYSGIINTQPEKGYFQFGPSLCRFVWDVEHLPVMLSLLTAFALPLVICSSRVLTVNQMAAVIVTGDLLRHLLSDEVFYKYGIGTWVLLVINTFLTIYCLATYVKSKDLFNSRRFLRIFLH